MIRASFASSLRLVRTLRQRIETSKAAARYRKQDFSLSSGPAVWYGGIPREYLLSGGGVKLNELRSAYPDSPASHSILYLVSSALPPAVSAAIRVSRERGVRIVLNQNGIAYPAWAGRGTEEINRRLAGVLHAADFVIYQSEFCRQSADRFLGSVALQKTAVLHNAVNTHAFTPADPQERPEVIRLVSMGSHHEAYRVRSALETVAALRGRGRAVQFFLHGRIKFQGGPDLVRAWIRELELEDCTIQGGAYSQTDAPALYQQADILLHPKYKDPCPTVPIEAMACGVPVIGSKSGGMPELVGQDGGLLVDVEDTWDKLPAPDPERMADAAEVIFASLPERRTRARKQALLFTNERWMERHSQIFAQVLSPGDSMP